MTTSAVPPSSLSRVLGEDETSKECRELMSCLPRSRGYLYDMYQYQGSWQVPKFLNGVLECQKNFQAQNTDVLLVTTPKSGTTWLKAILFTLLNRTTFPVDNDQQHPLRFSNPHELVPFMELQVYTDKLQAPAALSSTSSSSSSGRRILSTHMPLGSLPESVKDSDCKIVYLCRNAKDTFVSLWHFANKLRSQGSETESTPLDEAFDDFCRGVSLSGPFWDHVLGYWKESLERPQKVLFLKYEEVKENPGFQLRRLAEFLGSSFSAEEEASGGAVDQILSLCSFSNLSNLEVNKNGKTLFGDNNQMFFRKGEVGDWKTYLTPEMVERMDKISQEKFHGSGLELS